MQLSVWLLLLATGVDDNICLLSDSQDIMLGTESRHNINWLHNFPCQVTSSQFKGTLSWVNGEISKWLLSSHYTIFCSQQYNISLQSVLQSVFNIDDQINLANNASCQESVDVSFRAVKFDSNCSHCITATAWYCPPAVQSQVLTWISPWLPLLSSPEVVCVFSPPGPR